MAQQTQKVPEREGKKTYHRPNYPLTEAVIKEVMVQKNCSREKAIEILKNPTKH